MSGTRNDTDEPYVISDERLAEIEGLLDEHHAGWQVIPKVGVTVYDLAAAVFDLLTEREDRAASSSSSSGPEGAARE